MTTEDTLRILILVAQLTFVGEHPNLLFSGVETNICSG